MFPRIIASAVMAAVLAACASSGASDVTATSLPPPDRPVLAAIGSSAEYRVGPQDVLDITVFQVPELTRAVQVDASGHISLPLVGALAAAGKTSREIQSELTTKLSERYLQSPEVSVTVKEFTSQRVTVDGAVTQPGVYPLSGRTTLLQAVALAKGADRVANERQVVVFRTVDGQRTAAKFDLAAIRAGKMDDPEVYGNDVIIVDRSGARSVLREVLGAMPLLSVFRPF